MLIAVTKPLGIRAAAIGSTCLLVTGCGAGHSADQAAILVLNSRGSGVFCYLNALLIDGKGGLELVGEAFLGDLDLARLT